MFKFNFDYDKLYLKEVLLLIPKHHQNILPLLTPVLGLYGINVKEFINVLEEKTKFINYDIVFPVRVSISKIKTFEIFLKTPTVTSLLSTYDNFVDNSVEINFLSIYKICLVKSLYNNYFCQNSVSIYYKMIRSYLRSLNRNINFIFNYKRKKRNVFDFIKNLYNDFSFIRNLINFKKVNILSNYVNDKWIVSKFGFVFSFSGFDNKKFLYLKQVSSLYNVLCYKVFNNISSDVLFSGFYVMLSSPTFFNLYKLYRDSGFELKSQFLLLFVKLSNNICSFSFYKDYISSFLKLRLTPVSFFLYMFRICTFKKMTILRRFPVNKLSLLLLLKNINKNN